MVTTRVRQFPDLFRIVSLVSLTRWANVGLCTHIVPQQLMSHNEAEQSSLLIVMEQTFGRAARMCFGPNLTFWNLSLCLWHGN
jgi:hypothetical protein